MGGFARHRQAADSWRVEEREVLPTGDMRARLEALYAEVFGSSPGEEPIDLAGRLRHKARIHLALAWESRELVGFKVGYERKPGHFESWLGGVAPTHRGRGIASELMRRQHAWCRAQGYRTVRTLTMNHWREMLILDLRHGFDIVGTYVDRRGEVRLILERSL